MAAKKKQGKLRKIIGVFNPTTRKGYMALFVILFAVVGGGYMLYQSFAATSPVLVYGTNYKGLYKINSDGTGNTLIDASYGINFNSALIRLSPDKSKAAYLNNYSKLFVVNVATGAKHEIDVSSIAPYRRTITWANNSELVFGSSNDNNDYMHLKIYVIDTASDAIKQIASGYYDAQPQPGSTRVLLTKFVKGATYHGDRKDLYVGDLSGNTPILVAKGHHNPRWSADGTKFIALISRTNKYNGVLYVSPAGVVIRNLSSVTQTISTTEQPNLWCYYYLEQHNPWSVNGRYLIYSACSGTSNLYMYDTTKSTSQKPRQLTTNPSNQYKYTGAGFTTGGRVVYTRYLRSTPSSNINLYSIDLGTNTTTRIYGGGELREFSL